METALILFGIFLLLTALSVPIAFSMLVAAAVTVQYLGLSQVVVMQRVLFGVDSFPFLAVPLFLLAGELMELTGITRRLVWFANCLVGHVRGGLAHVTIVANMFMSGLSGSGTADAAATGSILIPAMISRGYGASFAAAVSGAGSVLGPIIPPSIIMVVYGAVANVSVGRLFVGGAVPGLVMGLYMMAVNAYVAKQRNYPREPRADLGKVVIAAKDASFGLVAPLIVLGGIIGGVFTPTEAAAVAVLYAFLVGALVYRNMNFRHLFPAVKRTFLLTAKLMFVIGASSSFAWLIARSNVPQTMTEAFLSSGGDRIVFLIAVNLLLLVLGCLMESAAIVLIAAPLLLPLATHLGLDPVHFGVMMTLNLSIGLITPPVGMVMYVVTGIAKASISSFTREVTPYFVAQVLSLITIIVFPALVTWLPNLLFGTPR